MKSTNKCPKCGSTDVIADARPLDQSPSRYLGQLTVINYRDPDALIFKGRQGSYVSAWICADCGFMELYVDSPQALKVPRDGEGKAAG